MFGSFLRYVAATLTSRDNDFFNDTIPKLSFPFSKAGGVAGVASVGASFPWKNV